jgi:hypothetical protein
MAYNRIAALDPIRISNDGPAVTGVTVTATLEDGVGSLGAGSVLVDLPEHGFAVLTTPPSPLDPDLMTRVDDKRSGKIRVLIELPSPSDGSPTTVGTEPIAAEAIAAEWATDVTVLGAQQWQSNPVTAGLELLAAFVMPNDVAATRLVTAASKNVPSSTGWDPQQAYQAGPERADRMAEAVFDAMRAVGVVTATPPPTWGDAVRIRTPDEVLSGRTGTCLDTGLFYAAALEQAGLYPLIWLLPGRAFVGYWRAERSLVTSATTEIDGLLNLVDLDLIRLVDTSGPVGFSHGEAPDPTFAAGVQAATTAVRADPDAVIGVLDVRAARRDQILPIPARVVNPDGSVTTVAYEPRTASAPESSPRVAAPTLPSTTGIPTATPSAGSAGQTEPTARTTVARLAPPRIASWKNALLDLSLRNRLLNYTGRGGVHLEVPPGMLAALEDIVVEGATITLLPADQVGDVQAGRGIRFGRELTEGQRADLVTSRRSVYCDIPTDAYENRMRRLVYRSRTVTEETGANNLYLALGSLVWSLDDTPLRSPLVLVPVKLTTRARHGSFRIELDESGTSTPNYCLLEKLRQVHGLSVPGLEEPTTDSSGIDLDAAFRSLRTAIDQAGLGYRVEQTADLALLAFAKFRLWKDLDDAWGEFLRNPLVEHLATTPTKPFTVPAPTHPTGPVDLDELAAVCPVPADASQLGAVAAAVGGETFVLEGPPGTGKSQTITNVLARAVATGGRVLFVAEKRAALDVVTRRLAAIGLAPFCLDLHDKGAKPVVVRGAIRAALDAHLQADPQGLAAATERLQSSAGQLGRYAARLHERNGSGLSYYSAHTQTLSVGDGPSLPVPESVVASGAGLDVVRRALSTLPDTADPARPRPGHPWGFVDPPDPAASDPEEIAAAAGAMDVAVSGLVSSPGWAASPAAAPVLAAGHPSDLAAVASFAATWAQDLSLIDEAVTQRWLSASEQVRAEAAEFAAAPHPGLDVVTPEAMDLPLEDIDRAARAATESSWFGRKKRQLAVVAQLSPVLRDGVTIPRKQIADLTASLVRLWQQVLELSTRVSAVAGLTTPLGWNPLLPAGRKWLDNRAAWLAWAGATASLLDRSGRPLASPDPFRVALRRMLESRAVVPETDRGELDRLAGAATQLAAVCGGDPPFQVWAPDGLVTAWIRTSAERRAAGTDSRTDLGRPEPSTGLRRYLALLTQLQPLRIADMDEARRSLLTGVVPAADAVRAFDSGVAASSTRERAAATGMDAFDPAVQAAAVSTFVDSGERVRDQLVTAIPAEVVASRSFDASSGYGRIGELTRELAKQRRGLTVRGLMSRYGDLITRVMPCTLVSPDSLARFFPPVHGMFDLVVFDEASQIRVADAVGALGRAASAVVVGDSKQMPPTSFAESSWSAVAGVDQSGSWPDSDPDAETVEDATVSAIEDEESILTECVMAGVARRWLSWHYRSQDESLIAFSNRRYYEDRLSSFPSPISGRADPSIGGHGVNLIRVDGEFLRSGSGKLLRTNPIEAVAVVTEIHNRFAASPDDVPSIGVVTFNAQQRTHIEALLRDLHDDRITEALDRTDGEGLFVKNLENVQGDERDVVLFSTAFSANARGVLPLNFGPLNQIGGERRLNVAITRARRQVLVFSSFDPSDLRADETSSQGIKDLRAYLELAASGTGETVGASPRAPAPDRHREEVATALAERGLAVSRNVGLSDFTLDLVVRGALDPARDALGAGRPAAKSSGVAVLLDGPSWAARRTVGDRDGLPVDVLSRLMGWPAVHRVWLPEWLHDRDGVLSRLEHAASTAISTTPAPAERVAAPRAEPAVDGTTPAVPNVLPNEENASGNRESGQSVIPIDTGGDRVADAPLPGEILFVPWRSGFLGGRDVLDALPVRSAADRVGRALLAGVEAEGPVHLDRLSRLVAGGFDLGRVTADRRQTILRCLPRQVLRDPADPSFGWPSGIDPATWTEFRRTGDTEDRPLEHISPIEIGNAMHALCVAGAGLDRDQLFQQTLFVFGFRRRTTAQLALLDAALARAVAASRLHDGGSVILAVSS